MRRVMGSVVAGLVLLTGACSSDGGTSGATSDGGGSASTTETAGVRLNALQYVGTHNSYHVAPDPVVSTFLRNVVAGAPDIAKDFGDPASLDYTHAPLPEQLAAGIRTFEIDVVADPTGGRFTKPALISAGFVTLADPDLPDGLDRPGFKVIHIPDIDWRSTCGSLAACFGEIAEWSTAHPRHLPIIINVELKSSGLPAELNGTEVLPIDGAQLDAFDAEARSLLGERLLTPDDVRGDAPDLRTALTERGWPEVDLVRGRVLIFMDNADLRETYLAGHPNLEGRVMFTSSGAGAGDGAILKLNDARDDAAIRARVEEGYLVRTRADEDVVKVRADLAGATALRDRAVGSGAQVVHTDFPPGTAAPNGYVVDLGGRVQVRCSPVVRADDPPCDERSLTE